MATVFSPSATESEGHHCLPPSLPTQGYSVGPCPLRYRYEGHWVASAPK